MLASLVVARCPGVPPVAWQARRALPRPRFLRRHGAWALEVSLNKRARAAHNHRVNMHPEHARPVWFDCRGGVSSSLPVTLLRVTTHAHKRTSTRTPLLLRMISQAGGLVALLGGHGHVRRFVLHPRGGKSLLLPRQVHCGGPGQARAPPRADGLAILSRGTRPHRQVGVTRHRTPRTKRRCTQGTSCLATLRAYFTWLLSAKGSASVASRFLCSRFVVVTRWGFVLVPSPPLSLSPADLC